MGLSEYHRKRDFRVTPEPRGEEKSAAGRSFVVQKHAATRLHYDFRLEMEGVLKSWAVPKGPCLDPAQKRLAMQTEDHPVDYGSFEGIIPAGEYGGGMVLLWDHGTWEPLEDAERALREGRLKFRLFGEKLRGAWMLVRTKGRERRDDGRSWLLFKERDDEARPLAEYDITAARPESVTTGRELHAIAADRDRTWHSNKEGRKRAPAPARASVPSADGIAGARRAPMPKKLEAQTATLVSAPPEGDDWLHELKFDGYRILARVEGGRAVLVSRNGKDWTARFPLVANAVAALPVEKAIFDGEVAVVEADGITSFQALQNWMSGAVTGTLAYFVFDLPYLDGYDLSASPLEARKDALERIVPAASAGGTLRFSQHVVGSGAAFFEEARRHKLEGIISKRRDSPYHSGRGRDWLKVKALLEQEFVVGGFTDPDGGRPGVGALLLGAHDEKGNLVSAGRVGTGFTEATLIDLRRRLDRLAQKTSPFAGKVPGGTGRDVHWVKPELVVQVAFSEWTNDGRLRHPSFKGVREDKPAADVVRERAETPSRVQAPSPAKTPSRPKPGEDRATVAGVTLTHPGRVLYPEQGITKRELASFYEAIADWILPHLEDRPTTLVRCPEGLEGGKPCFYQKHTGGYAPESLRRVRITEQKKVGEYLIADDLAGLIGLVQMGILEIHTWNATFTHLEQPDRLVFDLDPDPAVEWPRVVEAAQLIRANLDQLKLRSFVKTTGGKGLHVVVPLLPQASWDECARFAGAFAAALVRHAPDRYVAEMSKAKRRGKIFIDYLRNTRGATSIAAYSTRAKPNAPVSTPLDWDELDARLRSDTYTASNLEQRLSRLRQDPWKDYWKIRQKLPV